MGRLQRTHRGPAELCFKHVGHLLHEYTWPPELACPRTTGLPAMRESEGLSPQLSASLAAKQKETTLGMNEGRGREKVAAFLFLKHE